jgi:hypothetical protein
VIAVLFMLFPPSDSTRLWGTSAHATLAVVLFLLGLVVALRGLRHSGFRAALQHAGAVALYLLAISCHELVAPGVLSAFLLYRLKAGSWRPALVRWVPDVLALYLMIHFVTTSGTNPVQPQTPLGMVIHAIQIAIQAFSVLSEALIPVGSPQPYIAVAAVLGVAAAALLVRWVLPAEDPARERLMRWILIGAAGVLAVGVAYLIFVPAPSYGAYEPLAVGVGKRVNVLAGAGFAIVAYAFVQLLATLSFRTLATSRLVSRAAALGAAILIAAYAYGGWQDAAEWDRAADIQAHVLATTRALIPDPPTGAKIFTADHPAYSAPGVPAAAFYYDLNGAVKHLYRDGTISAFPIVVDTRIKCRRPGFYATGSYRYDTRTAVPYGRGYFVDVARRRVTVPRDESDCRASAASYRPGPQEESPGWR